MTTTLATVTCHRCNKVIEVSLKTQVVNEQLMMWGEIPDTCPHCGTETRGLDSTFSFHGDWKQGDE